MNRRVLAVSLVLFLVVVGADLFTLICFGRDGHIAAEPISLNHQSLAAPAASGSSTVETMPNDHGPCVDASLVSVTDEMKRATARVADASSADALTAALPAPPVLAFGPRGGPGEAGRLPALVLRSTVLRL